MLSLMRLSSMQPSNRSNLHLRAQPDTEQLETDDEAEAFESLEDSIPSSIDAGTTWGLQALAEAQEILSAPEFEDIQLFSFRAIPATKTLDIRLDKLSGRSAGMGPARLCAYHVIAQFSCTIADVYGSPTLEDISSFSSTFNQKLAAALGPESDTITIEVSSPVGCLIRVHLFLMQQSCCLQLADIVCPCLILPQGAERQIRVPGDLERFRELPMKVEWNRQDGQVDTKVLSFSQLNIAAGSTQWRLADVKVNRTGKGRGLNRQQRDELYDIPLANLRYVRLHLDF
jgi:ribosome maturation factor RimP